MRLVRFIPCYVAALLSLSAPLASAQPEPAEALFREGRQAMQRGDIDVACAKFRESLARYESIGAILNLAECEAKRGHVVAARDLWRRGLDRLPPNDDRRAIAEQRMHEVDARAARLRVRLAPDSPGGARANVDGRPADQSALELDPGQHTIEVAAPSCSAATMSITLQEGEQREITAPLPTCRAEPQGAFDRTEHHRGSPGLRATGWVVGALGVGALGVAAVSGAMALARQSTVNQACDADRLCTPEGVEAARQGRTLITINTVAFIAAGVGLAAGGILLWAARDRRGAAVRAQPSLGGATVTLSGAM